MNFRISGLVLRVIAKPFFSFKYRSFASSRFVIYTFIIRWVLLCEYLHVFVCFVCDQLIFLVDASSTFRDSHILVEPCRDLTFKLLTTSFRFILLDLIAINTGTARRWCIPQMSRWCHHLYDKPQKTKWSHNTIQNFSNYLSGVRSQTWCFHYFKLLTYLERIQPPLLKYYQRA